MHVGKRRMGKLRLSSVYGLLQIRTPQSWGEWGAVNFRELTDMTMRGACSGDGSAGGSCPPVWVLKGRRVSCLVPTRKRTAASNLSRLRRKVLTLAPDVGEAPPPSTAERGWGGSCLDLDRLRGKSCSRFCITPPTCLPDYHLRPSALKFRSLLEGIAAGQRLPKAILMAELAHAVHRGNDR